jgi:magnesium-transporting ATPase (P-type)
MAVTASGLTQQQVRERVEAGRINRTQDATSRSVGDILRSNLLTRFNALLGSMLVVILIVGPPQDALFGLILAFNALIGIAQELRAKVTLDRLAIVTTPGAVAVRDGTWQSVRVTELVEDDLLRVEAGDEIVVDGRLESTIPIEVNESLLTGEAAPISKALGDELMAGSFVSAGSGLYRVTRVGDATYARRMTLAARRFQLVRSELMRGINQILRVVTWIIVPTAVLLAVSQLHANPSLADAARASVAGVITLVPEGLVLLTSASLALAVIRLGRHNVLIQQLAAVEMLARADVVCFDKTGTLTETEMTVARFEPLEADLTWKQALGAIAAADPKPNASMRAVAKSCPDPGDWAPELSVPFSSDRKWSAMRFRDHGWWVVGAPDVLVTDGASTSDRRALLLARAEDVAEDRVLGLKPAALVELAESIKPEAAQTIRHLLDEGVAIKIISGDHPAAISAAAAKVGLRSSDAIDARQLPSSDAELIELVRRVSIYGRVRPEQKRALVRAIRSDGHTVAMVGDGVNDVLALKEADLGIALGGGSAAARAVAACVLTDGSFAAVPAVLAEGRRVIGNVERLASLFFTKTVYAFLLAIAVAAAVVPFPFLPRQLTLISAFTIGIPSAYLTLASSFAPSNEPFLRSVIRFAVPVGFIAAAATFAAYALAIAEPDVAVAEERTVATLVLSAIGLWVLARLTAPMDARRKALVVAMAAGLALTLAIPSAREFFGLDLPPVMVTLAAVGIIALALVSLEFGGRAVGMLTRAPAG